MRGVGAALNVVAVLAAVGAYILSAQAGDASGSRRTLLLGLGAALAGVTVVAAALKQVRDRRRWLTASQIAVDAEEEFGIALNGAFGPITNYLGEFADASGPTERAEVAGKIRQGVVDAAVSLVGKDARAAFYRANDEGTVLVREAYAGRPDTPRDEFYAGTPDGDNALDLVLGGDIVSVEDVEQDALVTPTTPGSYRCVVAVAVAAGSRRIGMLTVDVPVAGALTSTDAGMMRVLANLLGSGMAQGA